MQVWSGHSCPLPLTLGLILGLSLFLVLPLIGFLQTVALD
jgi:hypothetical protein